jgi:predicted aminopeptidase
MNWLGGDPLLNTFILYPEGEVARLMFHELTHQVLYVPDDTVFNESFATAVERLGGEAWLKQKASAAARAEYLAFDARRQQFRALARATRERLNQLYMPNSHLMPANQAKTALKLKAMDDFRSAYVTLKQGWGGYSGYDTWVMKANNAAFGAQAAYDDLVPGFEALFVRQGRDWQAFYDAVRLLARRTPEERAQQLKQWAMENYR